MPVKDSLSVDKRETIKEKNGGGLMGLTAILFFLYPANLGRSTPRDIERLSKKAYWNAGIPACKYL